jgi:aryl-alcohol dehydrogenase-like predicted oxidoreductase
VTWNILEPSAGAVLKFAHPIGIGVIVKEALANGLLTDKNHDPDYAPKLAVLKKAAVQLGTTVDALALAAALAQPWADVVLSGAATPEQLQANVKALDVAWDDELADSLSGLAEAPAVYWAKRSQMPWN